MTLFVLEAKEAAVGTLGLGGGADFTSSFLGSGFLCSVEALTCVDFRSVVDLTSVVFRSVEDLTSVVFRSVEDLISVDFLISLVGLALLVGSFDLIGGLLGAGRAAREFLFAAAPGGLCSKSFAVQEACFKISKCFIFSNPSKILFCGALPGKKILVIFSFTSDGCQTRRVHTDN